MSKTVLIVDDIPFVRKTLAEIFTQAHYQVVGEATDGLEAIKQYQKLRPDLVTMDIVMPEMSGIEATRKINRINPLAKVVIISAMGQEQLVMEAINVGAVDYILKPFTAQEVIKTAERVLQTDPPTKRSKPSAREKLG
jgi:two-component system, chemotaxis family, chemotaxis protein CheY